MAITGWLRSWQKPADLKDPAASCTQAALAGASLAEILELSARTLLDVAQCERAGVWLLRPEDATVLEGVCRHAGRPASASGSTTLDASAPFVQSLLRGTEPVVVDLHATPAAAAIGPVAHMRTAIWIPLRAEHRTFGLALLAYLFGGQRQELHRLRPSVEAIALALAFRRAHDRSRRADRMLQSRLLQTEKLAALGQLVSGIAHELNNPLTSISGYAQLLLVRRPGTQRMLDLHHIYQEAERARRIVQNLLLFARETRPERRPVDLNEIVERILALRSYELRVENISVELDLARDLPPVLADAHQLQQVVLNLLVNAEQAIRDACGEEALEPGAGRIRLRTRATPAGRIALEVSDTGPGVAPEIASRIFDPFFTTKPSGQGTGLGLSIAYGIVQEHDGEIYLADAPAPGMGAGAAFVVELPAWAAGVAARADPGFPRAAAAGPARAGLGKARVLVVEDEPTIAQLVSDVLSEEGHEVEAALASPQGLERALQGAFDLVICDLRMPGLDGRAFYQALVKAGSPLASRMIFITGDTLTPRTLAFMESKNVPYLGKPFLVEELKSVVHRVLGEGGPARGADLPAASERVAAPAPAAGADSPRAQEAARKP